VVSAWRLNRSLTAEFRDKGTAIATGIANSAVEILLNRDASTLQATIDQFVQIKGVAYVFVIDESGEIVSHTFVPFVPEAIRRAAVAPPGGESDVVRVHEITVPGTGRYIDISAPILAGVAGAVHIGMDRAVIAGEVRGAVLQQQGILLVVFLVSLLVARRFVDRTAGPLQALTAHVHRMARSDFVTFEPDARIERIADLSRDEVGELARAFRAMGATLKRYIEDLRQAKNELVDYSRSLERRVEERTQDLVEKNRAVENALERLREAQQQIVTQEKLASLGALTAGVAHEIKNPLNFVNNFAQVSVELIDELRESVEKTATGPQAAEIAELADMLQTNLGKIAEHGKRADSIVRNMLLHSRGAPGEPGPVDVNAMLDECIGLAYHGARAQDPSFNAKIERGLDPEAGTITAIAQDLNRAFLNLLTNACYALHDKRARRGDGFQPQLTVRSRSLGDRVEVRIRDNGEGIPADVRAKIFEPFFTTKPAGSGTGLGLSLTFDIVVGAHKGSIDVESEPGEFAEFVVTLPRRSPAKAP
jgi:two-component system NtrC family sensor kinase